jgi:kumamolisin
LDGTPWLDQGDRTRGETALKAAVAQGITVFVSSGDQGAYECQRGHLTDQRTSVSWPADSPWAVSVGGTLLSVRRDGTYLDEAGWEDVLENGGTGGGVNPVDARPTWQAAPGLPRSTKRQLPDVAAAADPDSGFLVVEDGKPVPIGGTSASAPFWAASTALIGEYAARQGAGRLPYLNELLYRLASKHQRFPPFHDVVHGGNRRDDARPGWDYATGLGSPDVYNLARDVAQALHGG